MTDFVIVAAAAVALAAPAAPVATNAGPDAAAASSVPMNAPTVGFRTYPDAATCEQAAAGLVARPGSRLVCLPVEPLAGDMTAAY